MAGTNGIDWSRFDNHMRLSVVGESHYQSVLMAVSGAPSTGDFRGECIARLVLEPENPHDPKAVMVEIDGRCVGYLSRHNARRYGKRLREMEAKGQPAICTAFVGRDGSSDNPNLGISLRVPYDGPLLSG